MITYVSYISDCNRLIIFGMFYYYSIIFFYYYSIISNFICIKAALNQIRSIILIIKFYHNKCIVVVFFKAYIYLPHHLSGSCHCALLFFLLKWIVHVHCLYLVLRTNHNLYWLYNKLLWRKNIIKGNRRKIIYII